MIEIDRIISDLEEIKKRPNMYIQPVLSDMLVCFLNGLERGVLLSEKSLTFHEIAQARQEANQIRGWKNIPRNASHEMRERNICEIDIIKELVEIEIEMWKLLQEWNDKNELMPKS
jgi:hypothetical protein